MECEKKGYAIDCGHYLAEEKPDTLINSINVFLKNKIN